MRNAEGQGAHRVARASEDRRSPPAPSHAETADEGGPAGAPDGTSSGSAYGRLALIADAVAADRMDLYLDPIMGLDDRRAHHFEVSVRIRSEDGGRLGAADWAPIARGTGLLARIDAAKLVRTAGIAERLASRGSTASLFSNLQGESLADDVFLGTFADVFEKDAALGGRLILSFAQRDVRAFAEAHWDALSTMAEIGLEFALEEVVDLDMDFEALKGLGFRFVKLDAAVFLEGMPGSHGLVPAADLCAHLSSLGLALIIGRIEDERVVARLLGFGVLFGQGTLFGAPRPVKIDGTGPRDAAA
jgi:cyclic-di-GMP phosphodiesterase TipF (flagellum assembly factor)